MKYNNLSKFINHLLVLFNSQLNINKLREKIVDIPYIVAYIPCQDIFQRKTLVAATTRVR